LVDQNFDQYESILTYFHQFLPSFEQFATFLFSSFNQFQSILTNFHKSDRFCSNFDQCFWWRVVNKAKKLSKFLRDHLWTWPRSRNILVRKQTCNLRNHFQTKSYWSCSSFFNAIYFRSFSLFFAASKKSNSLNELLTVAMYWQNLARKCT
jgi:hypothetical protein